MSGLTPRGAAYLVHEEAVVPEAYLDSKGVWTWGVGLATTGGYNIAQYKDNPQPVSVCLKAFLDAVNKKYLPAVFGAFTVALSENQLAAALSFHYNTGAIGSTSWVKMVNAGDMKGAQAFLVSHYLNNGLLTDRRKREAALFFNGAWPSPMTTLVFEVLKPSYKTGKARVFDPLPTLQQIMGGS